MDSHYKLNVDIKLKNLDPFNYYKKDDNSLYLSKNKNISVPKKRNEELILEKINKNNYIKNKNDIKKIKVRTNSSDNLNSLFGTNVHIFTPKNINNNNKKNEFYSQIKENKSVIIDNSFNRNSSKILDSSIKFTPRKNLNKDKINFIQNNIINPGKFYKKLMIRNIDSYNNFLIKNYIKNKEEEEIKEKEKEKFREENVETGIYGPKNFVSIIRARMDKIKMDREYNGKQDLKDIIVDELTLAKVKLKIAPEKYVIGQNKIKPLYIKKFDKYRYLSRINKIEKVNNNGNVPVVINAENIMSNLYDESYKYVEQNKFNKSKV